MAVDGGLRRRQGATFWNPPGLCTALRCLQLLGANCASPGKGGGSSEDGGCFLDVLTGMFRFDIICEVRMT